MEIALTPLEFMRRSRRLFPDRLAVVDGEHRYTYAQFFDRCDRWSAALTRLGTKAGDRVAYIAPNTHAMLESFYAVPQLGAVLVPINYRLTGDDFAYIIQHSGATIVCATADYVATVEGIRAQVPNVTAFVALDGPAPAGWRAYEDELASAGPPGTAITIAKPTIAESDLLSINYTSGTTARPKGVMITHRNAYLNSVGTLVHIHMTPADRYLWTLPMFHANGWTFVWTVTAAGGTHVCLPKVDPAHVFPIIAREHVSILCAAPTVLIGLAHAPDALRAKAPRGVRVLTAGAPPAAATIHRVEGDLGWEVTQMYGLTETAPFITICEPRPEHAALDADARATIKARQGVELVTSGEVRVVDDDGHEVPHDGQTAGEIVARGNVVMAGYYADPAATELAFRGGWFHSGDAAVVHPDGYVEIRDRLKDVIISGGENISSIEIESVLLTHPAVQEVAVVGMPHEKWGEAPHAFVVLRAGASIADDELRLFTRARLAHFKCPQGFHVIPELPKTATGKVQKFVLRGRRANLATQ
ncbi:MAG: long-chain-fatty-acid--CoA ligase [Deltaproteobacteria bacterium]|nr:long-chain-fatty-acid--CoA ligase [Deltaproteobacteria bacterium]